MTQHAHGIIPGDLVFHVQHFDETYGHEMCAWSKGCVADPAYVLVLLDDDPQGARYTIWALCVEHTAEARATRHAPPLRLIHVETRDVGSRYDADWLDTVLVRVYTRDLEEL